MKPIARVGRVLPVGDLSGGARRLMPRHQALTEADGYFHAWANFSFWHEKRFKAEAIGRVVRFTSEESSRERQVKTFQKSILRKSGSEASL